MNQIIVLIVCLIVVYWLPAAAQPVVDSLHETVAQVPDTAVYSPSDSESTPTPSPTPTATRRNQTTAVDSAKGHGLPADSAAASRGQATAVWVKQPPPDYSSSLAMALSDPDAASDYIIGKNYRLPDNKLFLLGGNDLFIVSTRLSQLVSIGMSGGPFFRSALYSPYIVIDNARHAAKAIVVNRRGIEAYSHDFSFDSDDETAVDIPFDADSYFLRDSAYFWMESAREIDFLNIELKSLQWYLNARLPCGVLSFMVKPLAYGRHLIDKAVLFQAEVNPSYNTMLFSKEAEITTDFAVRNLGINADIAFTRQVNKALSLYVRCPVEYRKITTDATRSIIAQFNYFQDKYGKYTRFVKLDTLSVGKSNAYDYYFSPMIGLRLDTKANLTWPFIFLPFIAQNVTLEGYFRGGRYCETAAESGYPLDKQFGGSSTSFQNIHFGKHFISGMENMLRLGFNCSYNDFLKEYDAISFFEYTPQLIFKEHFFVSAPRMNLEGESASDLHIVSNHQTGFGYFNDTWGLSCRIGFSGARDKNMYPESFKVMAWRSWK